MLYQKINLNFLFDLHQSMVINEHQYVRKMILNVTMGGLWIDFIAIFGLLSIYKDQFTFGIKCQNALCSDVECILNLSLRIKLIIFINLNQLNMLIII